jgi:hypothetical protein
VDFSIKSQRIHIFCGIPGNEWVDLNIRVGQIDSICTTWAHRRDGSRYSNTQDQSSCVSGLNFDSMCFLHIHLKEDFDYLAQELSGFNGQKIRSLMLTFRDVPLMEEIIDKMKLPMHLVSVFFDGIQI